MKVARGRPSKIQPLADFVLGLDDADEEEREDPGLILTPARQDALEVWRTDPWAFLTGKDPDTGEAIIKTVDQRDKENPVKAFPAHMDYLHYLVDLIENEEKIQIEKASQMVVTTTIILLMAWRCAFKDAYKVLLSKHKEEEAEIILAEKVRVVWGLMPNWLRRQIPVSNRPKNRCNFRKLGGVESTILGMTETAAKGEARGQSYQAGLIDEAEWQEFLGDLLTAMLPRSGQVIFWSTPAKAGPGVITFRDYLADDPVRPKKHPELHALKKKYAVLKGMSIRRNEDRGFTIVRIEHGADPKKRSKEWEEKAAREYPSQLDFRREMKIDRTSNVGRPFHPQFAENPRRFIAKCHSIPKGFSLVRGWDFGGGNPACVWGFWSSLNKTFWILRELLGVDIDTYQFRDLVKYLSGQLSIETLRQHPRAMQMLEEIPVDPAYPPPPWFDGPNRFYDFTGHEGLMGPRGLVPQAQSKTAVQILALGDIHLYAQYTKHSDRTDIINGLTRLRDCHYTEHDSKCEGHTGLLLDPACRLLIKGLASEIVYAKPTEKNPDPSEPSKDAIYSHLYDALGYMLTNVVALEEANYFQASFSNDGRPLVPHVDLLMDSYLSGGLNP